MKPQVVVNAFKALTERLGEMCGEAASLEELNNIAEKFDGGRRMVVQILVFNTRPEVEEQLYPVLADMREAFKNAKQAAYDRITKA